MYWRQSGLYTLFTVLAGVLISTYLAGWPRVTHDMVAGLPRANLHLFACECGSGRACEMAGDARGRAGEGEGDLGFCTVYHCTGSVHVSGNVCFSVKQILGSFVLCKSKIAVCRAES